jgi:hypothetical protein
MARVFVLGVPPAPPLARTFGLTFVSRTLLELWFKVRKSRTLAFSCSSADPDIPILKEAKAEYAKLQ